jgi:hypothetical protein
MLLAMNSFNKLVAERGFFILFDLLYFKVGEVRTAENSKNLILDMLILYSVNITVKEAEESQGKLSDKLK